MGREEGFVSIKEAQKPYLRIFKAWNEWSYSGIRYICAANLTKKGNGKELHYGIQGRPLAVVV